MAVRRWPVLSSIELHDYFQLSAFHILILVPSQVANSNGFRPTQVTNQL